MLPIIYTPTVGDAVKNASAIYQSARGLSLSPHQHRPRRRRSPETASSTTCGSSSRPTRRPSSASAIKGWGGLAISIGKLALYTAAGGVSPYRSLPVGLDVGTDREDLLKSPSYLGVRQQRLRGAEYLAFMDQFVDAVRDALAARRAAVGGSSKDTAFDVLERYRKKLPSFNDDIQGTGAVALAGLVGACALRGRKVEDEMVVVHGAGAGGAGVADADRAGDDARRADARTRRARASSCSTRRGCSSRAARWRTTSGPFAQPAARVAGWGERAVPARGDDRQARATVLLGLSGSPGAFTEPMVRALCGHVERPVVFPLSNPTTSCEATPEDLLAWSRGRAIVATGSPFEPVQVDGRDVPIGQGNNAFIFPGLGFGAILAEASEITDGMVAAASYALADYVNEKHLAHGPRLSAGRGDARGRRPRGDPRHRAGVRRRRRAHEEDDARDGRGPRAGEGSGTPAICPSRRSKRP